MQSKLLLFDFDGTIADSFPKYKDIINQLSKKYKYKRLSDSDIELLRSKGPKEITKIVGISWWKIPFLARDFKKEANKIIKDISMFKGMKEVLKKLKQKGYRVGILTSNSNKNVEDFLAHNKIEEYIDLIVGDVGLFSKAKKIEKAIIKEQFDKKDVFYIGDEVRDIESAKKVGIQVISVTWGFNTAKKLKETNPNFLANTPNELSTILMV
jgi:phosphoglycolate phosphatase